MRFWRPKSFLALLVLGFLLVSVPFVVALVQNAIAVGRLAEQAEGRIPGRAVDGGESSAW